MIVRYQEIRNDDSGRILMSKEPFVESDHPLWFFIEIMYTEYYDREWAKRAKYHVGLYVAGWEWIRDPGEAKRVESQQDDLKTFRELDNAQKTIAAYEYGCRACLFQAEGNNKAKLLKQVRHEISIMQIMIGFRLDNPQNAIGNTGWDFLRGEIGFKRK